MFATFSFKINNLFIKNKKIYSRPKFTYQPVLRDLELRKHITTLHQHKQYESILELFFNTYNENGFMNDSVIYQKTLGAAYAIGPQSVISTLQRMRKEGNNIIFCKFTICQNFY